LKLHQVPVASSADNLDTPNADIDDDSPQFDSSNVTEFDTSVPLDDWKLTQKPLFPDPATHVREHKGNSKTFRFFYEQVYQLVFPTDTATVGVSKCLPVNEYDYGVEFRKVSIYQNKDGEFSCNGPYTSFRMLKQNRHASDDDIDMDTTTATSNNNNRNKPSIKHSKLKKLKLGP
jgi:hypothetical protein